MLSLWDKIKKSIGRFLDNLAKENEKSLGSERLDCCQLNKNDKKN